MSPTDFHDFHDLHDSASTQSCIVSVLLYEKLSILSVAAEEQNVNGP